MLFCTTEFFRTLPNLLTCLRLLLIPFLVASYYLPSAPYLACATVILVATATDILDGYLARRWQVTSLTGAVLDPVADKLITVTSLLLLLDRHGTPVLAPVLLIIGREVLMSALRELMAKQGRRASVAVNWLGKVKTGMQMVTIVILFLMPPESGWNGYLGYPLLWLTMLWTLASIWTYLQQVFAASIRTDLYDWLRTVTASMVAFVLVLLVWNGVTQVQMALAALLLGLTIMLPALREWRTTR